MTDYRCDDCCYYPGSHWGSCKGCTPRQLQNLLDSLESARDKARREYDRIHREDRNQFIQDSVKDLREEVVRVWEELAPEHRKEDHKYV